MENKQIVKIISIFAFIVFLSQLILIGITIFDGIKANAQEPTTITLKAGTYRFNDTLTLLDNYINDIYVPFVCNGVTYVAFQYYLFDTNGVHLNYYISVNDGDLVESYYDAVWRGDYQEISITTDTEVDDTFGTWFIANTDYDEVNGYNGITIPYTNVDIPTDIQIMDNINMDINGFGSTTSNDNVGITALNGDTLGRLRTNDGTLISFNGIAVTSFDSWRPISTFVYPLTDTVTATAPFTISNGLMLYAWDDTQYYQIAWYNPADNLWYVHGDYAITVPYGHRSTTSMGTLTEGIAISLAITPNLSIDDIGYVELGGFEDTPPYDNITTVADEDAYSTFAMFCNANFISDSEKLAWGIAQHQSGQNLGQSQQLGENILGQFLQAPIDILDSIVIYTTPNGTAVTLMGIFGALLTLSLVIIFLKLFAGG